MPTQRDDPRRRLNLASDILGIMLDRLRSSDEIALYLIAFLGGEKFQLLFCFDAFGNHWNIETAGQSDDGAHDRRRLRIVVQIGDEALIDLDLVEWKSL